MKKVIFVILILFFTFSCEYQTEDVFFVKKEEPLPNKEIEINLAGVQPKDTIYVYQKTLFSYSLNIPDKDILKNVMKLDGTPINDNGWSLFLIEPEEFDNSIHKLTLSVELRTNTNSLAEKLGLEKYIGEYEYILKYVKVNHDLQIKDDITDASYLKIVWAKPLIAVSYTHLDVYKRQIVDELRGSCPCPSTGETALRTAKVMDMIIGKI